MVLKIGANIYVYVYTTKVYSNQFPHYLFILSIFRFLLLSSFSPGKKSIQKIAIETWNVNYQASIAFKQH